RRGCRISPNVNNGIPKSRKLCSCEGRSSSKTGNAQGQTSSGRSGNTRRKTLVSEPVCQTADNSSGGQESSLPNGIIRAHTDKASACPPAPNLPETDRGHRRIAKGSR